MANQITRCEPTPLISIASNNQPVTTSLLVAEAFGKRHSHVTDKIKSLDCSDQFRCANFSVHPYKNPQNGETYTAYQMTKDGFMFLVMGFTGKKAAQIKEAYINAFNQMESQLRSDSLSSTPKRIEANSQLKDLLYEQRLKFDTLFDVFSNALLECGHPSKADVLVKGWLGVRSLRNINDEQMRRGMFFMQGMLGFVMKSGNNVTETVNIPLNTIWKLSTQAQKAANCASKMASLADPILESIREVELMLGHPVTVDNMRNQSH